MEGGLEALVVEQSLPFRRIDLGWVLGRRTDELLNVRGRHVVRRQLHHLDGVVNHSLILLLPELPLFTSRLAVATLKGFTDRHNDLGDVPRMTAVAHLVVQEIEPQL